METKMLAFHVEKSVMEAADDELKRCAEQSASEAVEKSYDAARASASEVAWPH